MIATTHIPATYTRRHSSPAKGVLIALAIAVVGVWLPAAVAVYLAAGGIG